MGPKKPVLMWRDLYAKRNRNRNPNQEINLIYSRRNFARKSLLPKNKGFAVQIRFFFFFYLLLFRLCTILSISLLEFLSFLNLIQLVNHVLIISLNKSEVKYFGCDDMLSVCAWFNNFFFFLNNPKWRG